ncbi:hypothetical protein M3Y97_00548200 [Aphelenchoides bicaudatus]|nr:hypothetical protein M3Y97_00548200 [Aphelenchoides bicaudatus]
MSALSSEADEVMWNKACTLVQLVASSVRVAETAGGVIKKITSSADLKIVDKSTNGNKDLQTEADRAAQFCIEQSLQTKFHNKVNIVGEEEITSAVPNVELGACPDVLKLNDKYGTSEFAQAAKTHSPLLVQVTVLIGIAYKGRSVAGVIHQPFYGENGRTVWAIDGVGVHGLEVKRNQNERIVVTTRSHFTPMVQSALDILEKKKLLDKLERVGGAGYKVLKCLEDSAAYVFASPGCKKWDTAAPEAVIRASGGELTDISGRRLYYGQDAQRQNTGGVLATASWVKHQEYVDAISDDLKKALPEFSAKQ